MTSSEVVELGPHTSVDPQVEMKVATVGRVLRGVAAVYAVAVLIGIQIEPLGDSITAGPRFLRPIPPVSALALAAMALGALLAGDVRNTVKGSVVLRRFGLVLSSAGGLSGLIIMALYVTGMDRDWNEALGGIPAFSVGATLAALGVAIPLLVSRKEPKIIAGQICGLLVFSMTAVIFLGYIFGDPSLGRLFRQTEISASAATLALLTAVGVVLIRPASGLLSTASSPGRGGKVLRRFGPVVLLAPALLLATTQLFPPGDRVDATAFVAVALGLLLLVLLAVLVRTIDIAAVEASAAGAKAERAKIGLSQEAPLAANLSDSLHVLDLVGLEGWDVVTRFRPARGVVAGDTTAVRLLPDGAIGAVMVDVTGHGAEPALGAIRIRDLLINSLAHGHDPAEALEFMVWAPKDDMLASAVVLRVNPDTGEAAIATAGHPPVIHIDAQRADLIPPTGPLLFLDKSSSYHQTTITINPGDSLILFSDGVADVQKTRNGLPEPRALADMLLAEGGVAARSAELTLGFGEAEPGDDQSVIVVFHTD